MAKEKSKKSQTRVKKNQKLYKDTIITESYAIHRSIIFLLVLSLLANSFIIYHFLTFDHNKVKVVTKIETKIEEKVPENILFLGDSITEFYDLDKYYGDYNIVNSGRSGNMTEDILNDMKNRVYQYNPSKIFLMIGTNDLNKGKEVEEIIDNIKKIVSNIKEKREKAQIYIESIAPVNENIKNSKAARRNNEDIREINEKLKEYCQTEKITYIDLYQILKDEEGDLKEDYTEDGLHFNENGYNTISENLINYIKNTNEK